jgi:hypothetical protein
MTSILMAAAISGIVGGAQAAAHTSTPSFKTDGAISAQPLDDAKKDGKHACKGKNACKGQGGCKSEKHACKGQNACKGQGGCKG